MNCQPPICITHRVYVGLLDKCQASCQIPFMGPQLQPMCLDWAAAPIALPWLLCLPSSRFLFR